MKSPKDTHSEPPINTIEEIIDTYFMDIEAGCMDSKLARKYFTEAISTLITQARNEPVGDALEIKVPKKTMQYVMSKIKLKPKSIAARTLEPLWRIERWTDGKADDYDLEVQIWKLRILASLTHRFNWAIFLLKPENIKELSE